ncbi:MAG: ATP-dependent sacrificial sulfur transferase LarE [Elusimicrobiota bacterium]|jgi:uncharacterized protein|nr:ATP-dependent sacrificial sulfur transferase LarE [Elusimicrobiota bacterium]
MNLQQKYEQLKQYIASFKNAAIAFSGGVDSTLLLKVSHSVLRNAAIAVTARSCSFPKRELDETIEFCKKENIRHIIVDSEELDIEGFSNNPINRCYLCKSELFDKIQYIALQNGIENIFEGSNIDDNGDFRPGLRAIAEKNIKSPLRFAQLTKDDIRQISKELDLPTWNKQSFACLSSRFPYGEQITPQRLSMIDKAEQYLLDMGIRQVRVRMHDNLARIETDENGFIVLFDTENRKKVYDEFKKIGFVYIAIDILGYRSGSMNETLSRGVILGEIAGQARNGRMG